MRFESFDGPPGDGPLDRLDPRTKLVATLVYVVVVVATPLGRWGWIGAEATALAVAVGVSGLAVGPLVRRWIAFAPLVMFLALMVALGNPSRPALGLGAVVATIVAKNSLSFLAVMVLAGVTPFPRLLGGMGRLGAPRVLVATLHFMYRYLHVLADELGRMAQARRARTFRGGGPDWGLMTGLIGVLFLRAMERGERVHAAMRARGWDGTFRTLDDRAPGA